MSYVDLVVAKVEGTPRVFQAPAFTHLEHGDEIIVEGELGDERAFVIGSDSFELDSMPFKMMVWASESIVPLPRVLAKVHYTRFQEEKNE